MRPPIPPAQSLTELYQLRDRLKVDREKLAQTPIPDSPTATWQADLQQQQSSTLKETLRQTEARISIEEKANRTWQTAAQMANQAVLAGDQNVAEWDKAKRLWLEAIATLRQIPADSFQAQNAIEKIIEYQGNLGIVAYQQAVAQQAAAQQSQPELPAPVEPQTIAPQVPGFELYGDSNRDGVVNETDNRQPQRWSLATGPLMLFNSDDDDRDQLPDWRDQIINGQADAEDLAPIHFKLAESYVGTEVFISVDEKSQDKVNLFQKTSNGWKPVDLTGQVPLVFSRDIILGIEARQFADGQWDGLATLTARARRQGQDVATTALQLGVAPWIMSPSTAPVSELHISDRGANQALVSQVQSAVVAPESRIKVTSGGTAWMQEAAEIGYVQFPAANSASNSGPKQPKHFPMILEGQPAEAKTSESYAESLLGKEQGWFEVGQDHQSNPLNPTLDSHSNLGVTPPLPDFPLGRIYYGKADGETLNPEIVEFLKAQNVQGPPVEIDTSWLLMRHVDELISFVPSQTGEPLMLVASPADGVQLLEELASRGYGGLELNRELSTQTTIQAALNNQLLLQHNLKLQRQNIDPLVKQLKREFRLKDEQIIRVPLLFGYSGYAWWPNLVNAIYVNRKLLASNPRGPLIDGRDYLQEDFRRRLAIAGLDITFLDDQYYQELKGDLHMGTNTIRQPIEQPFWEILPASARSF
ncbi:MAG: protein-arginine deiminase [Oscillatoriales cyanobacterium RM1_1_9]|nr:protein-arginine deiminase [Oscillatoriales cyanobacterium RM1_1_9]